MIFFSYNDLMLVFFLYFSLSLPPLFFFDMKGCVALLVLADLKFSAIFLYL